MMSVVGAFAWQFGWRHRGAFAAFLGTVTCIGVWLAFASSPIRYGPAVLISGLTLVELSYFLAIFCFGSDCDLFASESSYPPQLLRFPLATRTLAWIPFLLGAVTLGAGWLLILYAVMIPMGELLGMERFGPSPILTPVVFIATLAFLQAALWTNYQAPLLRGFAACTALVFPMVVSYQSTDNGFKEAEAALLIGLLAVAGCMLSSFTLGRTRCGVYVGSRWKMPRVRRSVSTGSGELSKSDFSSPMQAQVWYEWKRYGQPLVLVNGSAIAFACFLVYVWPNVPALLSLILIFPIPVTGLSSLGMGGLNHHSSAREISPFFTGRPWGALDFVYAKWTMAALVTLVLCTLAWTSFALAAWLSGNVSAILERWEALQVAFPELNLNLLVYLGLVAYPLLIWVCLVQTLFVKLSGRYWLESFALLVGLGIVGFIGLGFNMDNPQFIPWTVTLLLIGKAGVTIWTLKHLQQREVVEPNLVSGFLACWFLLVAATVSCLHIVGFEEADDFLLAAGIVMLLIPINRLASAPLALHWNRHR